MNKKKKSNGGEEKIVIKETEDTIWCLKSNISCYMSITEGATGFDGTFWPDYIDMFPTDLVFVI